MRVVVLIPGPLWQVAGVAGRLEVDLPGPVTPGGLLDHLAGTRCRTGARGTSGPGRAGT
ncbi:hypothetical protein [Saccharothrix syringae]|uniref:hypothetical protein n=1 Tax=Saccharothrix syringae TaxID=103733 RepID=UPI000AA12DD5|nr:hypothetical protein [Saccharothrix syringae]